MPEKNSSKHTANCCSYCGWKLPTEFLQDVSENCESVFCENCGTEIVSEIANEHDINSEREKRKNHRSYINRIYENIRNKKNPIDRVLNDSDFPLIFKENLIIVISRLISTLFNEIPEDLSKELLDDTAGKLEPVMSKRINQEFLINLHKITLKGFENHLKRLQGKIRLSSYFRQDFAIFLRWLVKKVHMIAFYSSDAEELPKFDRTILKDLKSFNSEKQLTSENYSTVEANSKKKRTKYWFLDEDEKGIPHNSGEKKIKAAAKYMEDIIIPNLISQEIITPNQRPTTQDLKNGKWSKFLYQLHSRKIDFKLVMGELGFQKDYSKYSFMYYDKQGKSLSRYEKIQAAKKYFEEEIIPSLIKDKLIEANQVPSSKILEKTRFDSFFEALLKDSGENCKIYYKDFLWWSGYENVMDKKIWIFLDRDEDGIELNYQSQVDAATDYFIEKIVPDLIKGDIVGEHQIPLQRDLNESNYLFLKAINRRGIYFGHILENAGYLYEDEYGEELSNEEIEKKIRKVEHDRNLVKSWEFLYKKSNNSLCTRGETINLASEYLVNKIIPNLEKLGLKFKDRSPRYEDLVNNNYGGFLTTLGNGKWPITYNEILFAAGFKLNRDTLSYSFIDKMKSSEEKVRVTAEYFKEEIIPELIKGKFIKKDQIPTKMIIRKSPYRSFIWAIDGRNIHYNKILKYNSYEINRPSFKWNFLFKDENGRKYSLGETIKIASDYFKKIIIPQLLDEGKIVEGQIPFRYMVNNNSSFLYAVWDSQFQITYAELVENAGLIPNNGPILSKIGNNLHIISEKLFLQHTRSNGCDSFYEAKGFDNVIYVDESFKNLSQYARDLIDEYKEVELVIIDYYLGNSRENINKHIKRGYQNKNRLLILVPIFAQESSKLPDIENVELYDPKEFVKLFGYDGELRNAFFSMVGLVKESIFNVDARLILRKRAVSNLRVIKEFYPFKQKEFMNFLGKRN